MLARTITELQSLGLRSVYQAAKRQGGAGPAEGITLLIKDIPVTVPVSRRFVQMSPYTARKVKGGNGQYILFKKEKELFPIDLVPRAKFYDRITDGGTEYWKIALLHGKNCLASTIFQKCVYWNSEKRCKFCGIELSLKSNQTIEKKTPKQLAEVASVAKKTDDIQHVVLTTGSFISSRKCIKHIGDCAHLIKSVTNLPIHVQIEPPRDLDELIELKDAGVDTIGMHIESFDFDVLSKMAPAKAELGLKRYISAWKKAVEIFGKNQVSSFLIVGLGERRELLIDGTKRLAELGVYPFLVPLRPIPGSLLENALPPAPELMIGIYEEVSEILKGCGIFSKKNKAGCVLCGACSALPVFETDRK